LEELLVKYYGAFFLVYKR
jgi:hypothetical protein